jgi:hypothetical protein
MGKKCFLLPIRKENCGIFQFWLFVKKGELYGLLTLQYPLS